MQRSDLFRPTFRLKLLIALLGTIAPLLLVTLLVVQREADHQVDLIVQSTTDRAGDLFARIEQIRQQQLDQLGYRFSSSNRLSAAFQQALEGDTTFFVDQARYELQFAGFPNALAAFTNLSGEPLAAIVNGQRLTNPERAVSKSAVDRLFAGHTAAFGYHLLGSQLFSIHPLIMKLVDEPVGILLLGFAIDDETARSLGQALRADVCFVADNTCIASSTGTRMRALESFAHSARTSAAQHVLVNGKPFVLVARPLVGARGTGTQIVLSIPLEDVIRPFTTILRAIRVIGFAVLLLAIIIAIILSRGFARPVRALVAATSRVARGEYDTHVVVKSKDEMGMLANAFNDMTHGLLLKEKYRGVLDKVVSRDVADEMLKGEIQLGGETRVVTTLFADVRNFTAMTETLPPHEVIELLNGVMERAEAAVVAEGGVVDKYVGDEIMALFGAPVAGENDALHAIRAAVRIQREMTLMNEQRVPAGKPPITLGVGVNTGTVVAGNMGSQRRLNYTVLGAPVNLAARLCSEADGGQILISESTLERVREHVHVAPLGARPMKGFSRPVDIFEVVALESEAAVASGSGWTLLGAALLALTFAHATPALAQRTYNLGPVQVQPSAHIDAQGFITDHAPAWLIPESKSFAAGRASGYLDVFAGQHVYGLVELRADRGEAPAAGDWQFRIEQAFVRLNPGGGAKLFAQVGRFVSPFGSYPQRHGSSSDPLIRPPLSYDYRTMVCASIIPETNDDFINWKDIPQYFRPSGAPPVWAAPYQLGAMLLGNVGRFSYRVAAMNGAPSSEPRYWNLWPQSTKWLSYAANVGMQIAPELRVGASFDVGTYLSPDSPDIPAGAHFYDYTQRLFGIDGTFTRGFIEVRGELIHDYWEVPRVPDDPTDLSYYLETKIKVLPGAFVSGRYSAIHFNSLHYTSGSTSQWDYDTRRLQLGAGYRISQPLEVRAEMMLNHTDGPIDPRDNLLSLQASWTID